MACPKVATWGGQGRVQLEPEDLGHVPLLRSGDRLLWGSKAKARLVNWNQKNTSLVSCMGVLSKHKGKAPSNWQTVNYKGTWKRKIRNLTFACDSLSSYLGHAFAWAAGVSLRSLQVTRPKQNGCQGGSTTE